MVLRELWVDALMSRFLDKDTFLTETLAIWFKLGDLTWPLSNISFL